jgi:hypothetical protein
MKTILLLIGLSFFTSISIAQETVKIGSLEIMTEDLGEMNWDYAAKACSNLGNGWRLPTLEELRILFENKDKIGGFTENTYWSSDEHKGEDGFAYGKGFMFGEEPSEPYHKSFEFDVRAVRATEGIGIPTIEGEYSCSDNYSSNSIVITKNGESSYSFFVSFHSEKNTDFGGHLFEHEDVFENVNQHEASTICKYTIGDGCTIKLTISGDKCSIDLAELGDCLYPVQVDDCVLQKVK